MHRSNDADRTPPTETFRGSLLFLTFGLVMLAFLVAIDRPEWFKLRPVSGTAIAMAKAPNWRTSRQHRRRFRNASLLRAIHLTGHPGTQPGWRIRSRARAGRHAT